MDSWNDFNIGKKIRLLRKLNGLTQKQLAERSGIAEITIRQYEAEKYNPKPAAIMKLCAGLDCKPTDLIDEKASKDHTTAFDTTAILKAIEKADPGFSNTVIIDSLLKNNELSNVFPSYPKFKELFELFELLNDSGKEKAVEQIKLLTKIPEFQKHYTNEQ